METPGSGHAAFLADGERVGRKRGGAPRGDAEPLTAPFMAKSSPKFGDPLRGQVVGG